MPLLDAIANARDEVDCTPSTRQRGVASVRRRPALAVLIGLSLLALASPAAMAAHPDKPIKLVVPFAPGGGTDTIARILADEMAKDLGQNIIVDNRPGAGTIIGTGVVASSEPDGYTLLMATPGCRQVGGRRTNPLLPWLLPDDGSGSMSDAGDITPSLKGTVTGSSVVVGAQEVAAELEEVVDLAVAGEEPLGMPR